MSLRYRRLTDLFVKGKAVPLPDGVGHLWVQVINSYEREECVSDAQIARSRLILALKEKGDERTKVEGRLAEMGFTSMAKELATSRAGQKIPQFADEMRDDPEWSERMEILLKTDFDDASSPALEEETILLAKFNAEIMAEFNKREADETDFLMRQFNRMTDEEFLDEWVDEWIDRKGTALAGNEYRLTELWYASRFCEATVSSDGILDHGKCDGHRDRIFASKAEARSAPEDLQMLIRNAIDDMALEGRDPKDLDSAENSSASSPTPSEPEASTASTPTATPPPVRGT
jgi:hypothetical protein